MNERLALEAESTPQESPALDHEEALVHEALGRLGSCDREVTARGKLHRARCRFRAVFEELLATDSGHGTRMRPATGRRYFTKENHEHA